MGGAARRLPFHVYLLVARPRTVWRSTAQRAQWHLRFRLEGELAQSRHLLAEPQLHALGELHSKPIARSIAFCSFGVMLSRKCETSPRHP